MVTVKADSRRYLENTRDRGRDVRRYCPRHRDERHLADLYADYLGDEYAVVTAYTGEEGIERLTSDVDVVLVDRRMAGLSGHEVVAAIEDSDVDCRVALVTDTRPTSTSSASASTTTSSNP